MRNALLLWFVLVSRLLGQITPPAVSYNGGTTSAPSGFNLVNGPDTTNFATSLLRTDQFTVTAGTNLGNITYHELTAAHLGGAGTANNYQYGAVSPLPVNWMSSDTSKATVSSSGYVTYVAPGTATISAVTTDGRYGQSFPITETISAGQDTYNLVSVASASFYQAAYVSVHNLIDSLTAGTTTQQVYSTLNPYPYTWPTVPPAGSLVRNASCFLYNVTGVTGISAMLQLNEATGAAYTDPVGCTMIASDIAIVAGHTGVGNVSHPVFVNRSNQIFAYQIAAVEDISHGDLRLACFTGAVDSSIEKVWVASDAMTSKMPCILSTPLMSLGVSVGQVPAVCILQQNDDGSYSGTYKQAFVTPMVGPNIMLLAGYRDPGVGQLYSTAINNIKERSFAPVHARSGDSGNVVCWIIGNQLVATSCLLSTSGFTLSGTPGYFNTTTLHARIDALRAAAHAINPAWGNGTDYPTILDISSYPSY